VNCNWQRKYRWIGHVLRHDGLLHDIIEGRMRGKPTSSSSSSSVSSERRSTDLYVQFIV